MRSGDSRVHLGSFSPFLCVLGVVEFTRIRSVHSSASWGSFGALLLALWVVAFVRVRSVHSRASWGSLGSFGPFPCAFGFVGFIRVRFINCCVPWGSLVSFVYVLPIPVCLGGCRVYSGAFCPVSCVLVLVRCILVHPRGRRLRSGFSVHYRAPWWSPGSIVCVLSILVRPGDRRVHVWSIPVRPGGRRVHSGSFCPFPCPFPCVLRIVQCIIVHPGGRRVR